LLAADRDRGPVRLVLEEIVPARFRVGPAMKPIVQLTKLLRSSTKKVQLAIDDPEKFVGKYEWSGMDPKDPILPWLALLDDAKIADLDWKSDFDEVMAQLGRKMGDWEWVESVKSTGEFIERVSLEL